jgi:hypothetical protein
LIAAARRGRARLAQLHERGLGEVERAGGIVGAREVHLRARVVRDEREDALEGDDRLVDAAAVERRHAEEVVELGLPGELACRARARRTPAFALPAASRSGRAPGPGRRIARTPKGSRTRQQDGEGSAKSNTLVHGTFFLVIGRERGDVSPV